MGYRCLACENNGSFNATQETTQYVTENIRIDDEGGVEDYFDSETTDSEVNDGPDNIECSECESGDVEWFDTEEDWEIRKKEYDELKLEPAPNWKKKIVGITWKDRLEANPNDN